MLALERWRLCGLPPFGSGGLDLTNQARVGPACIGMRYGGETVKSDLVEALKKELASRGFKGSEAPNGTMTLGDEYLIAIGIGELMIQLVARREKIFRSVDVVGMDVAKNSYDDAVGAVEAVKAVIEELVLNQTIEADS